MNFNHLFKPFSEANPISPNVFCADPTAVEFEGRLYVYGTNDHEQFLNSDKNTYEKIKSLVCFSTDDMVNWTYHGQINVGKIAPWIINSWAPTICSRKEEDGLTHFYLYFSNNGCGTGVITATSPLGPWSDPLKKPLVHDHSEGLENCPNPFDPGVVIDDEGNGWLSFGAGIPENGTKAMPGSARIAKLGKDMISFESDFVQVKAPYNYEANELNFINGTYVYTYNNNWEERSDWEKVLSETKQNPAPLPPLCSMAYMTSKNPLDSSSWEYKNFYFKNPGQMGFSDSNNHTHLHKFNGKWYLFYHTLGLQDSAGITGGFRSLCVDQIQVDEKDVIIHETLATKSGVPAIKNHNAFEKTCGTTMFTCADVDFSNQEDAENIAACSKEDGAWILIKNVDFGSGADFFTAELNGKGSLELRIDDGSKVLAVAEKSASLKEKITGLHDLWLVFSHKNMELKSWKFGNENV